MNNQQYKARHAMLNLWLWKRVLKQEDGSISRIELKERTSQRRRGLGGGKYFTDRCCGGRSCKDDGLRKAEVENEHSVLGHNEQTGC